MLSEKRFQFRCERCGKPLSFDSVRTFGGCVCSQSQSGDLERTASPLFDPISNDGAFIAGFAAATGQFDDRGIRICRKNSNPDILSVISECLSDLRIDGYSSYGGLLHITEPAVVERARSILDKDARWEAFPEDVKWSVVCGIFEALGEFCYDHRRPEIRIAKAPEPLMEIAACAWNVEITDNRSISATGHKAIDICGRMYKQVNYRYGEKYDSYIDILNWEPFPQGDWLKTACFKCKKLDPRAVVPQKKRPTDSGYDIFAVELTYDPETDLYTADTRLAVEPIPGYYFDMVGRSSLPSTGFFAAGGVGIIDRGYVGSVKMRLKKFRDAAPVPTLPFRFGQLIPRKIIHIPFIEVGELGESDRGKGGFGSTGV